MAFNRRRPSLALENATIMFRNFSGREDRYNAAGRRNFCVIIEDPTLVEQLTEDGWNVRVLRPRDEDDTPTHYIPVEVGYKVRPPKVVMIAGRNMTELTEDTISTLDYADIVTADIEINPRSWDDNGTERIKAYLKEMYVTIQQSAFADKYAEEEFPGEEAPF